MSRPPENDPLFEGLNPEQRDAVSHRDGPLLVLAGPGSGKTRVITRRAARIVRSGVLPRHVLAITFTNKAADEMRGRIEALGVARGMWVCTFHALGVRLLRELGPMTGVQPGFTIYDTADQLRCVKDAMELCKVGEHVARPEAIAGRISDAKNNLRGPEHYLASGDFFDGRMFGRIYDSYQQLLKQRNAVDFDDLLMKPALLLRDHPEVTERLNERFRYVLIDEYQDTNHAQYLIAQHLSKHHRNLCATGDPDQSIYAWRGADIRNILEFERDYPEAKVVRLEQNYRSTGGILRAASELIRHNRKRRHKELWSERGVGEPVAAWEFQEGRDEAEKVAETIRRMHDDGRPWRDFAIFYRINAVSRGLEESLRNRGIPYRIARGVEFYNRREIRDTLAYLRLLVNPADDVALLRILNVPARGIGKTTVERLILAARRDEASMLETIRRADRIPELKSAWPKLARFVALVDGLRMGLDSPVEQVVSDVLSRTGLEADLKADVDDEGQDRLANVQELVTAAARYMDEAEAPTLEDYLARVSLAGDQDAIDPEAGVVYLMTLHAAKGLEFPVVFLVGLEQGMLPHERALRGEGDLEEERRLTFVGMTRAMDHLYLSHARERVIRGAWLPRTASQFLAEVPGELIETQDFGGGGAAWWQRHSAAAGGPSPGRRPFARGDQDSDDDERPTKDSAASDGGTRDAPPPGPSSAEDIEFGFGANEPSPKAARSSRWKRESEEPVFSPNDPTGRRPPSPARDYSGWKPAMFVRHEQYGVGQIIWIRPGAGQTRASIKFPGHGERTFILELAPVEKLERK